jgi:hypothetical protein
MVQIFKKDIQEDYYLFWMHGCYKKIIHRHLNDVKDNIPGYLGKSQISEYLKNKEPSNICEDEIPRNSIELTFEFLRNYIGKIAKSQ